MTTSIDKTLNFVTPIVSEGTRQKTIVTYGSRRYSVSYVPEQKIEEVKERILAMVKLYHDLPDRDISSITYNKEEGKTQIFYKDKTRNPQNVQDLHKDLSDTLTKTNTSDNKVNDNLQTQLEAVTTYMNIVGKKIITSSDTSGSTSWVPNSRPALNPHEESPSISIVPTRNFTGNSSSPSSHRVPKAKSKSDPNIPKPVVPNTGTSTQSTVPPSRPNKPAPAPLHELRKQREIAELKAKDELLTTTNAAHENKAKILLNKANDLLSKKVQNPLKKIVLNPVNEIKAKKIIKEAFKERAKAANTCDFDKTHPLFDLSTLPAGTKGGKFVTGMDTGIVKQGTIHAMKKSYDDGSEKDAFTFNLSHHARDELQTTLDLIQKDSQKDSKLISRLSAHCREIFGENFDKNGEVTIKYVQDGYDTAKNGEYLADQKTRLPIIASGDIAPGQDMDSILALGSPGIDQSFAGGKKNAIEITFGNIGKVRIGNDERINALYNQVQVELNADENSNNDNGLGLSKLHGMMSLLGVGPVVCKSRDQDEERLKIGIIFHTFFPREAFKIEREANFYSMDIEDLKKAICADKPQMEQLLAKYLDPDSPLQKQEVYPGKEAYVFTDMANELRNKGAVGLMSGVGGTKDFDVVADIIVKMFEAGAAKSSKSRFQEGLIQAGGSSDIDHSVGGADSVFTRMVTKNWENSLISRSALSSTIQIFWKLEAANVAGTYASVTDTFGARGKNKRFHINSGDPFKNYYSERPNLLELAQDLSSDEVNLEKKWMPSGYFGIFEKEGHNNEVMIKEQIPLTMAAGLGVSKESEKQLLIKKLSLAGFICDKDKILYIKIPGSDELKSVDEFIHVTQHEGEGSVFKNKYWEK